MCSNRRRVLTGILDYCEARKVCPTRSQTMPVHTHAPYMYASGPGDCSGRVSANLFVAWRADVGQQLTLCSLLGSTLQASTARDSGVLSKSNVMGIGRCARGADWLRVVSIL